MAESTSHAIITSARDLDDISSDRPPINDGAPQYKRVDEKKLSVDIPSSGASGSNIQEY